VVETAVDVRRPGRIADYGRAGGVGSDPVAYNRRRRRPFTDVRLQEPLHKTGQRNDWETSEM